MIARGRWCAGAHGGVVIAARRPAGIEPVARVARMKAS